MHDKLLILEFKSNTSIDVGYILNVFNVNQCERKMPENTKINITPKVQIIHKIKLKTVYVFNS